MIDKSARKDDDDDGHDVRLKDVAEQLFKRLKPDVIIVDEGHHFPASSWGIVEKFAVEQNSRCQSVLLTATPVRGDGRTYGLTKGAPPPPRRGVLLHLPPQRCGQCQVHQGYAVRSCPGAR